MSVVNDYPMSVNTMSTDPIDPEIECIDDRTWTNQFVAECKSLRFLLGDPAYYDFCV